jgi:hypothetical protein
MNDCVPSPWTLKVPLATAKPLTAIDPKADLRTVQLGRWGSVCPRGLIEPVAIPPARRLDGLGSGQAAVAIYQASRAEIADGLPGARTVQWSVWALVGTTWFSTAVFGLYILTFYGGAGPRGTLADWNHTIPRLYEPATPMASIAMGAHFFTGATLLLLGPVQLLTAARAQYRVAHRWVGRIYVLAAGVAGLAGLGFIAAKGTVGGPIMSAGFALYGALVTLAAVQTYRYAQARRFAAHRAWAIRLFALAMGSWLYRMEYGFWIAFTDGLGSTQSFTGPFDHLMAFAFYLPNLAVAELLIRAKGRSNIGLRVASVGALSIATGLTLVGSYFFIKGYWGPGILASI